MTDDSALAAPPDSKLRRGYRVLERWQPLWVPPLAVIIVLGVQSTDWDSGLQNVLTLIAAFVALVMLMLWVFRRVGLSVKAQIGVFAVLAVIGLVFTRLVRIEGVSGTMVPYSVSWVWTPKRDARLAASLAQKSVVGKAPAADAEVFRSQHPNDFPQFLGPDRNGVIAGPTLERDWAAHPPRALWRQPIGSGWSSFAVVGKYALTQEQRGDTELVTCYEARTGKLVWSHGDKGRFTGVLSGDGTRATPTITGGQVFTMGGFGQCNCLDGPTGKVVWSVNVLSGPDANLTWGLSCSPLVLKNQVIVTAGHRKGGALMALDRATGKQLWAASDDDSSYSSPMLAILNGQQQIVIVNAQSVSGHVIDTGKMLWRHAWPGSDPKVTQPVPIGDHQLFIAAGYGIGCEMLDIKPFGDAYDVTSLWQNRNLKPKFTNVLQVGGDLYGLDEGVLMCLDPSTGERRWKAGRYGHGQVLAVGKLLVVQAEEGEVVLVEANPERLVELGRFQALSSKTWNIPTVAGKLLLVRNDEEAACYELPLGN